MKSTTLSNSTWIERTGKPYLYFFFAVLLSVFFGCGKTDTESRQTITAASPSSARPSPTLKIEQEERQSFGDYTIISRWFPDREGSLKITRGNQTVFEQQGERFYAGSSISEDTDDQNPLLIATGNDITGKGKPNLVVMEWSGGAHCCSTFYVFELGDGFRQLAKIETADGGGQFTDLNGDSRLEFITYDATFAYWRTSFGDSPMPKVILTFRDDGYHIADNLMSKPAPSMAALAKIANRIGGGNREIDPDFYPPSELWKTMLELIYTGHADLAGQFFEMAWNPKAQGMKEFYEEFQSQLRKSSYWPEIKEMNSNSRK